MSKKRGYDDDGLYFMTMFVKDFYKQIKHNGKISICGLNAKTQVNTDNEGLPIFNSGYAIRMTGNVAEVSIDEIKHKNNPIFDFCIKDSQKYPGMVVMCITSGYGDIFDYDFKKEKRPNKLQREYFAFGGCGLKYKGLTIDQNKCIKCGKCKQVCSFLAISFINGEYIINKNRCDECADCFLACPEKAISNQKR